MSASDLGRVRGEVNAKVAGKLSETEKGATKLTEELAKQTKRAKDSSTTLHELMVSIANLGENMIKMSNELSFWRETKAMDTENEFAKLVNPISLLEPAKSQPKVIDLLSTSIDTQPPPQTTQTFSPLLVCVVYTIHK